MKKLYIILFFLTAYTMSAQLVLNEAAFDVAPNTTTHGGDNNEDGIRNATEDEFLEFINNSASPLDISGYTISDGTELRHTVPSSTIIPANGIFVVFGGGDLSNFNTNHPTVIAQVASSGGLGMNDTGDTMTIQNASEELVITLDGEAEQWDDSEDQSIARFPNITGDFIYHQLGNGIRHSAGELQTEFTESLSLVLNEILADPESTSGDANGDLIVDITEDEFLEFFNNSGGTIDISGYKLHDFTSFNNASGSKTPRHIFPLTSILDGQAIVVFGGGTPSEVSNFFGNAIVQTASDSSLSLGNTGDAIIITDASDNVVFIFDYESSSLDLGNDQSITRSPDITGGFSLHTTVGTGLSYSPGLKIDGTILSTKTFEQLGVSIYPNPVTNGLVYIKSKTLEEKNIELFDVNGRRVLQTKLPTSVLDVSTLKSGFYVLKISIQGLSATSKLIIN
ncbi:hypothetical protein APS56_08940 [Pseudalgibacter alginicilyticus]|uniref:LTD domain-containing protein n=1 Tax=Pseudalgibacter alginicilyticus TaxID=1736674 RepID=A0A0P0CXF5_9FLAO|nr:lamin tail domain-containing protein [Pseudalgibacter alginicilyticus]ALJ05242.1 hypothetical protein APS56_08940 [Pseudalgibacter alginicilyticus]